MNTITVDRAVELLHVSRRTIYNYIKQGKLHVTEKKNSSIRISMESVLMEQRRLEKDDAEARRSHRGEKHKS